MLRDGRLQEEEVLGADRHGKRKDSEPGGLAVVAAAQVSVEVILLP